MSHKHSTGAAIVIGGMAVACVLLGILAIKTFAVDDVSKKSKDTTNIAVACFAVTAVISLMPFNLAPTLDNRQSDQFKKVVKCGMQMCLSSICFMASALSKHWIIAHSEGSRSAFEYIAFVASVLLFLFALASGLWGLFHFTAILAHECYCSPEVDKGHSDSKQDDSNPV